ncbi:hypothetical protein RUM43_014462 [Polyplax serrata]|uniref:Uncharacterized protein n=1 Tax=Polyplax serrata TaxID=468196 RepID=A0AAN8NIP5_POLSC
MDIDQLAISSESKGPTKSIPALIFGGITSGLAIGLTVVSTPFIFPYFRRVCLPYVPATTQQVENILYALKGRSGNVIDLGSGDGRIVLATAQNGFQSTGVELNPWLVAYSKLAAFKSGFHKNTRFLKTDLWKFNLEPYNNVVIFGVDSMMTELELKFLKELKPNTVIVACRFPLKKLKPVKTIGKGIDTVWIYQVT